MQEGARIAGAYFVGLIAGDGAKKDTAVIIAGAMWMMNNIHETTSEGANSRK